MSDLVGNPEDRFSHNEAHIYEQVHQSFLWRKPVITSLFWGVQIFRNFTISKYLPIVFVMVICLNLPFNIQLKRYVLSTPISRSFIDLPEIIEAKLFINPLLYSWNINSAIYSSKSFTITAYFSIHFVGTCEILHIKTSLLLEQECILDIP